MLTKFYRKDHSVAMLAYLAFIAPLFTENSNEAKSPISSANGLSMLLTPLIEVAMRLADALELINLAQYQR